MTLTRPKKLILGSALLISVAVLLVACGGGKEIDNASDADPVAETERKQALGLFDKLPVSWTPSPLVFSLNPGSVQTIPLTLTTTKALTNAKIVFVPDLRNAVTVTPEVIPSLAAGQSATVTLTFAPKTTDTRKMIAGVVLLFDKNATVSRPLPVKVSLVKPETINGVVVPSEPPPELNNATLAGFDVNGNGVRDDVERMIVTTFGGTADLPYAIASAREFQRKVTLATPGTRNEALAQVARQVCAVRGASMAVYTSGLGNATANTASRKQAVRAFNDVLIGYVPQELPPCAN